MKFFWLKNEPILRKFKIDTPKNIFLDEFIWLRSKAFLFVCGSDDEIKLKGTSKSQSKNNKFEEYKSCLDGADKQNECDNYIIRSINHEMYLQRVLKSTLSPFDDKRCYISRIECAPWN